MQYEPAKIKKQVIPKCARLKIPDIVKNPGKKQTQN
jgi:hypothetical protein